MGTSFINTDMDTLFISPKGVLTVSSTAETMTHVTAVNCCGETCETQQQQPGEVHRISWSQSL